MPQMILLMLAIRRAHDLGKSGEIVAFIWVPFYGLYVALCFAPKRNGRGEPLWTGSPCRRGRAFVKKRLLILFSCALLLPSACGFRTGKKAERPAIIQKYVAQSPKRNTLMKLTASFTMAGK